MSEHKLARPLVRTENIIGIDVINNDKENLGKIEEIVLDKKSGQVMYVVLSFGGILGLGNKLFAMPWSILHYSTTEDKFIIDYPKELLKKAPGFDKDKWPSFEAAYWRNEVLAHYEIRKAA
jgi:sporulation protein YlmC with PRC-barrel domain